MPPHGPSLEDAPFSDDELDLYLTEVDPAGHASRWSVTDAGAAEWAMSRLAGAEAEIADAQEQAAVWRSRVDDWLAEATARPARFAAFLRHHLEEYALALRAANPKAATTTVPSGKVATRWSEARPVIANDQAVLEWLDERDEVPDGAIKRAPLVSKLKPILTVAPRSTGRWNAEVACCGALLTLDAAADGSAPAVGLCSRCGAETPEVVAVEQETVLVVIDSGTGEAVPGFTVEPGHYSVTVTPNRG